MQRLAAAVLAILLLGTAAAVPKLSKNGPSISASPDVLPFSGSAALIQWSGVQSPAPDDFFAIYVPSTSDLSDYIGFVQLHVSPTWQQGYGEYAINLENMRSDYSFALWTTNPNNASAKIVSAVSNGVKFASGSEPTQIHIALGPDSLSMRVMWVSGDATSTPAVLYGTSTDQSTWQSATGVTATYSAEELCASPGNNSANFRPPGSIHDVLLSHLAPSTTYYYIVGSQQGGWSSMHSFVSAPTPGSPVDVVAYGDLGVHLNFNMTANGGDRQQESIRTVNWVQQSLPQLALHIGDISYARGYAFLWDYFFGQVEPVAARVPYMVCIGNHEYDYIGQPFKPSWSDYNTDSGGECGVPYMHRFHMPETNGGSLNLWYSFDFGNVHFVLMSTEHDFTPGSEQYNWIVSDLAKVNRAVTPFVVFSGHRPMYDDSSKGNNYGPVLHLREALEPVLVKYKVNLALWGHVHKYERSCGVVNGVCADDDSDAPVHVVIGMAGNDYQDPWETNNYHTVMPEWTVFRSMNFGYTRFQTNSSHLHFAYYNNQRNEVHDEFYLHV